MTYTTQGLMTPDDLADHQQLTDTHVHPGCPGHQLDEGTPFEYCAATEDCPGADYDDQVKVPDAPMDTYERLTRYLTANKGGKLTPAQRRRLVKKAGKDPAYVVTRDTGMGFADPARQGMRELANGLPVPVSGAPY